MSIGAERLTQLEQSHRYEIKSEPLAPYFRLINA